MIAKTPFLERSNDIVRAFLSSVVLVDDQAYLVPPVDEVVPKKLASPGRQGGSLHALDTSREAQSAFHIEVSAEIPSVKAGRTADDPIKTDAGTKVPAERDHTLDGKIVIDGFAKIGVVCAVMRPTKEELDTLPDLLAGVGVNSDVVILDWVLHESKLGEKTLELIERLVTSAAAEQRTRLIVVYTAEPDLTEIERKIRKQLNM